MSETILITGGAGFIGSNLVHRWHRTHPQDRIVVLDKLTYAADRTQIDGLEGVELVVGDVQNLELARHLIERHGIRKVFHLAAESHVDRSITGPAAFIQTNVLGTFAMLEAARQAWAGQKDGRFLHISTDEVYGSLGETGKFHEAMAYAPNSPYSASKAGSDHLVRAYHHTYGLNTVTTNCSNNYGPRQHPEKLIPLAISRMAKGEPIPVYGDGQNVRDWLYVEDHCAALELVMEKGVAGETYCVGGDNEWKNLDLLHLLCDTVDTHLGRPEGTSRKLLTFVKDRAGHDRRYAIDATRIQAMLGWKPDITFPEGLQNTVRWYLA
ncbi:dTDP-glucose 4,6-dehydratase [Geothrix rubra]|uniref:dTDP-glucose 4,6-dehydratase n=1 Tax=Geothrix rubra TaxID=2927977 RepID=A0ABQ5Q893_9BACT|nr:dTDP-glucose 4,6-dehydratase [Geothrix rubra]GLH70648.1 dTDP-glucose 4,6-dehydratase [Geothrix rubra]